MITLKAFKVAMNLPETLEAKKSPKTGRIVISSIVPLVVSKKCDTTKELFVTKSNAKASDGTYTGEEVYVICNQGWEAVKETF